ncbi:hypothetical protein L9F63_019936, partial [Diploptera punctata]
YVKAILEEFFEILTDNQKDNLKEILQTECDFTKEQADMFLSGYVTRVGVGQPGTGKGVAGKETGKAGPGKGGAGIGGAGKGGAGARGTGRPGPGGQAIGDFDFGGLGEFDKGEDNWITWLAKKLATEVAAFAENPCTPEESSRINLITKTILDRMKTVVGTPPPKARAKTEEVMKSIAECVAMWIDQSLGEEKQIYATSLPEELVMTQAEEGEIKEKDEDEFIQEKPEEEQDIQEEQVYVDEKKEEIKEEETQRVEEQEIVEEVEKRTDVEEQKDQVSQKEEGSEVIKGMMENIFGKSPESEQPSEEAPKTTTITSEQPSEEAPKTTTTTVSSSYQDKDGTVIETSETKTTTEYGTLPILAEHVDTKIEDEFEMVFTKEEISEKAGKKPGGKEKKGKEKKGKGKKGKEKKGKGKKGKGKKVTKKTTKTTKKTTKNTKGGKKDKKGKKGKTTKKTKKTKKTMKTKKLPPVEEEPPPPELDLSTVIEEVEPPPEPEPEPEPAPQLPPDYAFEVNSVGNDLFYISKVDLNYRKPERTESDILREEEELMEESRRKHELKLLKEKQLRETDKEFDEYIRNLNKRAETIKFGKMLKHMQNFMSQTPDDMPKPETMTEKLHLTLHEKFLKLLEEGCPCPDSLEDLRIIARNVSNQVAVWIEEVMYESQGHTSAKIGEHFEKCLQEVKAYGDVKLSKPIDSEKEKKERQIADKEDKKQLTTDEGITESEKLPEETIDKTQDENLLGIGDTDDQQKENPETPTDNAELEQNQNIDNAAENAELEQNEATTDNADENAEIEQTEATIDNAVENPEIEQNEATTDNVAENPEIEENETTDNQAENAEVLQDQTPTDNIDVETPTDGGDQGTFEAYAEEETELPAYVRGEDTSPVEQGSSKEDETTQQPTPVAEEDQVRMKEWAEWLTNTLDVAEDWASFIGATVAEAEQKVSKKQGLIVSPDGKVEKLTREEWKEFQNEIAKNIREWRRKMKEIREEANKWNEKKN